MKISGIFTIKNGVYCGYPFIESLLSVIPIVDEFLINDAGSSDDTFFYLNRLKKMYPKKIRLFKRKSFKSEFFEWIDDSLNYLMKKASGDWIFEVQGDEIWHEKDIVKIPKILEKADGCNSIRHSCLDCNWKSVSRAYIYRNVRIIRNIPGIKSFFGGDDFRLNGAPPRDEKYTTHNVPPELEIGIGFYHFSKQFPKNAVRLLRGCAKYTATKDVFRKKYFMIYKKKDWSRWFPPKIMPDSYPAILRGINRCRQYYSVREELFNKDWLSERTNLKY
jgi:hypothetical protein